MEEQLKHRLAGAVVLVAIGVIVVPMILEGPDRNLGPMGSNLPDPPHRVVRESLQPLKLPLQPKPSVNHRMVVDGQGQVAPSVASAPPATAVEAVALPLQADAAKKLSTPPVPAVAPTPDAPTKDLATQQASFKELQGWVVQVGSFGSKENAYGLRDRLRGAGFPTFVEQSKSGSSTIYRVRVGPEVKRADAEITQGKINKQLKTQAIVTQYP